MISAIPRFSSLKSGDTARLGNKLHRTGLFAIIFFFLAQLMVVAFLPGLAEAVTANPSPTIVKQPDGNEITVLLKGDEYFHWNEDGKGYVIIKLPKDGTWVYAEEKDGYLVSTPHIVGRVDPAMVGVIKPDLSRVHENLLGRMQDRLEKQTSLGYMLTPPDTMLNLVVLVNYSDLAITYTTPQFDSLFNYIGYTSNGATGSVRDYYDEVSYDLLTVVSAVVVPVTISHGYAYYGANDAWGWDLRPREMVEEALAALEARGFDFSTMDGNGDGWIDGLTIIHAGGGEEYGGNDPDYIWSHKWQLSSPVTYDGVSMQTYHTEPARRGWDSSPSTWGITRIGVICHENGHFIGLPDLYDYDYDSRGVGDFCLMAGGSWNGSLGASPAHPSAWCKVALDWVTPTLISSANTYWLDRVETNQEVFKLQGDFPSNEYFLIENRQAVGFDAALPGTNKGILIWHIDENQPDNDDQTHYKVDLEEASGTQHLELDLNDGDDMDYFRSGNATNFTSMTTPSNLSYGGNPLEWLISDISASGSSMSFSVANANTPPTVAIAIPNTIVAENSGPINNYRDLNDVFTDLEDGRVLTFTIESNSNPALVAVVIDADSALDLSFASGMSGAAAIVVRATDSGALFVEDDFVVTVTPSVSSSVAHWNFNEMTGNTVYDLSGIGNHGTKHNGADWDEGCSSGSLRFHGSDEGGDDYVIVPHSSSLRISEGTIEIIFRLQGGFKIGDPVQEFFQKEISGFADGDLQIMFSSTTGRLYIEAESGETRYSIVSDTTSWSDRWYHLAYVFDSSGMRMYINKVLQSDHNAFPASMIDNTRDLAFGYSLATSTNPFKGRIDEIRITDHALSPGEFIYNECIDAPFTLTTNIIGNGSIAKTPDQPTYLYGDTVIVEAFADAGWKFDSWSNDLSGSENPDTIVITQDMTITGTFTPRVLTVTVTSDPIGRQILVENVSYISPQQFAWEYGITHEIGVSSHQEDGDTIYEFEDWSDGGAITHTITVPDSNVAYIASFKTYYKYALINSIVDIPNDQGGWVRIHLERSWYDSVDEEQYPIATYNVWRRVDDPALVQFIIDEGRRLGAEDLADRDNMALKSVVSLSDIRLIEWQRRYFSINMPEQLLAGFPLGTWEIVGSFAAAQMENYIYASPTLGDSSETAVHYTVFAVSAHSTTPRVWFMSPPDSGYSVDNIAPEAPEGFSVAYNTGDNNHLTWALSEDEDFQYFRIYRSDELDFTPALENLVDATVATEWRDPQYDGWKVYYKITTVDYSGNESKPASAEMMTGIEETAIPKSYALFQNVPNPFNPMTTIQYDVPAGGGEVTLRIYDVRGQLVRTLVDGIEAPGVKKVTWDGRNEFGARVASGIYFYKMIAPGYLKTRKMLLLQ